MTSENEDRLNVKPLKPEDFDALVELDSVILGSYKRKEYWEKKLAIFRLRHPNLSLVAYKDDKLAGYIMGNISGWEFGVMAGIGWVELIGVDPNAQRKGIGRELTDELLHQFQTLGVKKVYTMVLAKDVNLRKLFSAMGFEEGHMVQLEKDL
ncbi:GNAT family N-acetyltransferase [bacterium]|nr:GNAT family N-acetyltransferase [bacterium]